MTEKIVVKKNIVEKIDEEIQWTASLFESDQKRNKTQEILGPEPCEFEIPKPQSLKDEEEKERKKEENKKEDVKEVKEKEVEGDKAGEKKDVNEVSID